MKIYTDKQIIYLSYILLLVALFLVLKFNIFACFFSGFLVYEIVELTAPLINRVQKGENAKIITTTVVAIILVLLLSTALAALIIYLYNNIEKIFDLQDYLRDLIVSFHKSLAIYLPESLYISEQSLQDYLMDLLKNNVYLLQNFGKDAAHIFTNIIFGLIIGLFISVHKLLPNSSQALLKNQLLLRINILALAFRNIVFAQVKISAINTILTAIFLLLLLPIFGVRLPLAKTLVILTFIVGLLPVIGNLISNTIIFLIGFSLSPLIALAVLSYLILIHKLEYFLNAKIIGNKIKASAWELLIAMFVMQSIFGFAGIIAAPIYYAYVKSELKLLNLI